MSEQRRGRGILRRAGTLIAGLLGVILFGIAMEIALHALGVFPPWDQPIADALIKGARTDSIQKRVRSKDGTFIAYEQMGRGPVVVLVSAALADRDGTTRLAKHLAERFTVVNYDRRGRGGSSDIPPYAIEREVEDIEALIDASGGSAFLGSSSGAVLALDAANTLGAKIKKLFMYEPPFIIDDSRPPMPDDFIKQITVLTSAGRQDDAVKLFFTKGMGIPSGGVTMMRLLLPGWSGMAGMARTLPYDLTVLSGTQAGTPLPAHRWSATTAPTLVMVGSRSEAFFHNGAQALTGVLPGAHYRALEGQDHSAVLMASKILANEVEVFFLS